ncbi:hypothetical protein BT67DRAFT_446857 [Trichocladium antarcticum]|uniref:Uncharacterized protein n=1 Tax=Trichocladium antarcticum TaxID=1450529 RepID=A0AAN6UTB4_9PEZI|nr:hypothetical protein BT67DRAFT_446857 [Trichocladium antarcticum]
MQRSAGAPTAQGAAPFFSSFFGGSGGGNPPPPSPKSPPRSRPPTSLGDAIPGGSPRQSDELHKDRKPSFGRKLSFNFAASSPSPAKSSSKRRPDSPTAHGGRATPSALAPPPPAIQLFADSTDPAPAEPIARSPASPSGFSKMLGRAVVTPINGYPVQLAPPAHEGRIYWFNTLLFDKPDLQRMPYFDPRKLARRATNYLLLGISLPAVIDLNSATAADLLRSLHTLLSEFEAFQQLHSEHGASQSSLTRAARIPQIGSSSGAHMPSGGTMAFGAGEVDLLPGEEYAHLLTPTLPFEPDFFETFATLCDVLIDTYARLLGMVATPRECGGAVAELFAKADAKVRKLLVQGVIKEFEETSRAGARAEVASVGRVVLSGLM